MAGGALRSGVIPESLLTRVEVKWVVGQVVAWKGLVYFLMASTGSRLEAIVEGMRPESIPTPMLNARAITMIVGETTAWNVRPITTSSIIDAPVLSPIPTSIPSIPPKRPIRAASARKIVLMLVFVAPIALSTPISCVRSATAITIVFIITTPPTTSEIAAIPARTS